MQSIQCENHPWFMEIFDVREKWVPVYLNSLFWAGMTTTQRVESMNSFLDKYLRRRATLSEFVVLFERALKRICDREHESDYESKYKTPKLATMLPMEKQFREAYTNTVFYRVQREMMNCLNLHCRFANQINGYNVYVVTDMSTQEYEVSFNLETKDVACICRLFETNGILCSHAFGVLSQQCESSIQDKYIVDRWRKEYKRMNLMLAGAIYTNQPELSRYFINFEVFILKNFSDYNINSMSL